MTTYETTAYFDGTWWTFEIASLTSPSARGSEHRIVAMGQARKASAIAQEATNLASLWTGEDSEEIDVVVRYKDFGDVMLDVDRTRELEERGRRLIDEASALRREAVAELRAAGLSQADTASILGISRQRVQQLENATGGKLSREAVA
ncbi:MAG: helix-turn-helix transcriptional regulator [Ancrocorticia sp.]